MTMHVGRSPPLGATVIDGGVNFTVFSRSAAAVASMFIAAFVAGFAVQSDCQTRHGIEQHGRRASLRGISTIRLAVPATIVLSIFAHGVTAQPGINLYAKRIAALDETSPKPSAGR